MDSASRTYWFEGKSPLGFATGPRLDISVGDLFAIQLESVPPTRFANLDATRWEVVASDGRRQALGEIGAGRRGGGYRDLILATGDLVEWRLAGWFSLSFGGNAAEIAATESDPNLIHATAAATDDGGLVEGYEVYGRGNGLRRLRFITRDRTFREISRRDLPIPDPSNSYPGEEGRATLLAKTTEGYLLLVSVRDKDGGGQVRRYALTKELAVVRVLPFVDFDPQERLSLAVSSDGALFTTGQAAFTADGTLVRRLPVTLRSCLWRAHALLGVKPALLIGNLVRGHNVLFHEVLRRNGFGESGLDESGKSEEIVTIEFP